MGVARLHDDSPSLSSLTLVAYVFKMKGTIERPTHLFRFPVRVGGVPQFLDVEGDWRDEPGLLSFVFDDPIGADDISPAIARRVAANMGMPTAVPVSR